MKTSTFSEEQIASALREVEGGRPPADVYRRLGVSLKARDEARLCLPWCLLREGESLALQR